MRIGLVIYGHLDLISGGYLYDRQLVDFWRAAGHEVTIFSLPWRSYWHHLSDNWKRRWQQDLLAAPLDILVQDELNHPSLLQFNRRARQQRPYPIITLVHLLRSSEPQHWLGQPFSNAIERHYLRQLDGIIVNSNDTARAVEALCNCRKPTILAYPGRDHWELEIDAQAIETRAFQPGPLRILYVGNYVVRKGLDVLLQALAPLPRDGWQLTAIGRRDLEPDFTRKLEKIIDSHSLHLNVSLRGQQPFDAMPAIYRQHQLFVMPSRYEPFGIAYLEALGAGLPIIATTAGAASEFIENGVHGFLVEQEDATAIRFAIENLLSNRLRLAEIGIAARQQYNQHPTWHASCTAITHFLQQQVDHYQRASG